LIVCNWHLEQQTFKAPAISWDDPQQTFGRANE
jgi:hypothetical protein